MKYRLIITKMIKYKNHYNKPTTWYYFKYLLYNKSNVSYSSSSNIVLWKVFLKSSSKSHLAMLIEKS